MGTNTPPTGIPSARGIDHVGYNVPDLESGIAFFTDVLGFTLLERGGRTAMLQFGDTLVELLQFLPTDVTWTQPGLEDAGGYHLALTVDDCDAAVAYLGAQPGVRLLREPDALGNGRRRAFLRTPWGATIQLITPRVDSIF
ncbi:MAG TPA: VOC family protein [Nitrolancea sp.]|jgi:catechol 2,3-dioxygenase-like lactoylglutathione lyase family enzyme|nr:VOC family protein [Nitrolancea sp.]